jgi:putative transposase
MQIVRQMQFKRTELLDTITHLSKNLFNLATYTVRQRFFVDHHWTRYKELWDLLRTHDSYQDLQKKCGAHPPQQVLRQVDNNFKSFFQAMKAWKINPTSFSGRPRLPSYKPKDGYNLLYFTEQQIRFKSGFVWLTNKMKKAGFPLLKFEIPHVKGVRIVPFGDRYNIEIIYDVSPVDLQLNPGNVLSIDLGLTNIVTTADNIGGNPVIIKGGVIKSINHYFNKKKSKFKSLLKNCNQQHNRIDH